MDISPVNAAKPILFSCLFVLTEEGLTLKMQLSGRSLNQIFGLQ
jgi:hypothetical protein